MEHGSASVVKSDDELYVPELAEQVASTWNSYVVAGVNPDTVTELTEDVVLLHVEVPVWRY